MDILAAILALACAYGFYCLTAWLGVPEFGIFLGLPVGAFCGLVLPHMLIYGLELVITRNREKAERAAAEIKIDFADYVVTTVLVFMLAALLLPIFLRTREQIRTREQKRANKPQCKNKRLLNPAPKTKIACLKILKPSASTCRRLFWFSLRHRINCRAVLLPDWCQT